jgi:hypothetical protein
MISLLVHGFECFSKSYEPVNWVKKIVACKIGIASIHTILNKVIPEQIKTKILGIFS